MDTIYPLPAKILVAHAFVDGAYLREEGKKAGIAFAFPNPQGTIDYVLKAIREMGGYSPSVDSVLNRRTYFYDAAPAGSASPDMEAYWKFVEELDDTGLRFGEARGRPSKLRQKGVDVLLAVDMLVGAVDRVFDVAILVTGDADFVPVVNEVRRRGISVVVGGIQASTSQELRAAADRFIPLDGSWAWALNRNRNPFIPPTPPAPPTPP